MCVGAVAHDQVSDRDAARRRRFRGGNERYVLCRGRFTEFAFGTEHAIDGTMARSIERCERGLRADGIIVVVDEDDGTHRKELEANQASAWNQKFASVRSL